MNHTASILKSTQYYQYKSKEEKDNKFYFKTYFIIIL